VKLLSAVYRGFVPRGKGQYAGVFNFTDTGGKTYSDRIESAQISYLSLLDTIDLKQGFTAALKFAGDADTEDILLQVMDENEHTSSLKMPATETANFSFEPSLLDSLNPEALKLQVRVSGIKDLATLGLLGGWLDFTQTLEPISVVGVRN